jgi:hypothetical protein
MVGYCHAGTILFQVTDLGPGASPPLERYTYTYNMSGITLLANQELDIVFSAAFYGTLSNGVVSPGFDLILLQPNNPPGTPGHFSALALSNIGVVTGPWSVDFLFNGPGTPGSQPFFINQYDANGRLITTPPPESGTTQNSADVPEPGTFMLLGLVVIGCGVGWAVRRRNAGTAPRRSRTS